MLDRIEASEIPDLLPESVTSPSETFDVEVEFSMSMHYDLRHIRNITGLSYGQLIGDFTNLARGSTALAQQTPGEGLFRDAAGYDEQITIDHPEFKKDIDWLGRRGKAGHVMQLGFVIDRELSGILMEMANERKIELDELYKRILRMGISFFRDKVEYGGNYFVQHNGEKNELSYEFFYQDEAE